MWPFKGKEKITYMNFVLSLYSLASDITNNYDFFNDIINKKPYYTSKLDEK
jgi:hypothetical protein